MDRTQWHVAARTGSCRRLELEFPVVLVFLLATGCPTAATPRAADIPYWTEAAGGSALNRLDVYAPDGATGLPVVVYVHGGGWRTGDKANVLHKPAAFNQAGYVFVSIGYRLSPAVQHPAHAEDVARAIGWVRRHIAEYGGDGGRLYLLGHSAGAHLVALVGTDERYLETEGLGLSALDGVVALDGAGYDIPRQVDSNPRVAPLFETAFGTDRTAWPEASPVNHAAPGKTIPPFLLIHAGKRTASELQATALAAKLTGAGYRADVKHAKDRNHTSLNRRLGLPGDEPTCWILDFAERTG